MTHTSTPVHHRRAPTNGRRPSLVVLAALTALTVGVQACSGSDSDDKKADDGTASSWTSLGGLDSNFRNDRETRLTLETAEQLIDGWAFQTTGQPNGTPAVVGTRVFATSTGRIYCLDRDDATVIWEKEIGTTSSPTYADGVLYVHGGDTQLMALNADDGEIIWTVTTSDHPAASITSSPVVAGDLVLVGISSSEESFATTSASFRGAVAAYDISDGAERWRYATAEEPHNGAAVWSTVSVDMQAGVVFGTSGNNYTGEAGPHSDAMFAITLERGERVWLTQLTDSDVFTVANLRTGTNKGPDYDFGTNPILFEGEIDGKQRKLVGAGQKSGVFWALDRETGEVVWQHRVSFGATAGGILNNGAFDGERILVSGYPGLSDGPGSEPDNGDSESTSRLVALNVDGSVEWEKQLPAQVWGPITSANGVAFVPVFLEMHVIEAATGKVIAIFPTEGTICTGAAIADGRAYFGSGVRYSFGGGKENNMLHQIKLP